MAIQAVLKGIAIGGRLKMRIGEGVSVIRTRPFVIDRNVALAALDRLREMILCDVGQIVKGHTPDTAQEQPRTDQKFCHVLIKRVFPVVLQTYPRPPVPGPD